MGDVRRGDPRSWVISIMAGAAAYVTCSHYLFFAGGVWQLPLFVGMLVGLVSLVPVQAAVVSVGCMLGGMLLSAPLVPRHLAPDLTAYVLAVALSAIGGMAPGLLRSALHGPSRRRLTLGLSALLVAWAILNMWMPLFDAGVPSQGYGSLKASAVRENPAPGSSINDDALYRRIFYLMRDGRSYYVAYNEAWKDTLGQQAPNPNSPTGVRLPTYYWFWRLLPADAFAIVYLYLAFASVGTVAASFVAGQLVGVRLAPLAATTFAAYALAVGLTVGALYVDLPAMSVALVGIALFLRAVRTRQTRVVWAAAATLALAALTREILAYVIVLAALSALLQPTGERGRWALPWLAALGAFALGYAAHVVAVWPYITPGAAGVSYLKGGVAFVADGLTRFSAGMAGRGTTLAAFVALGVTGAVASRRRAGNAFSAFAVASIVLPFVVMLRVGNPGVDAQGTIYNYWGMLVVPLALALWPAAALLVAPKRE